jgi:hypothetical protein
MSFFLALGQGAIIAREAARSKGAPNWAWKELGRSAQADRPRPISAPVSSRLDSHAIPYLCALACGLLASFPSRLRLESLLSKLRYFLVESLKTGMFIVCLDSCWAS